MIPTTVKISKEFFGIWVSLEASVIPSEDTTQAYTQIEKLIDNYYESRMRSYAEVYGTPNGGTGVINNASAMPPSGDLASDINSCQTLKILESYKFIVKAKPELKEIYDLKYEELKNSISLR